LEEAKNTVKPAIVLVSTFLTSEPNFLNLSFEAERVFFALEAGLFFLGFAFPLDLKLSPYLP